jgi:hypothetical protein
MKPNQASGPRQEAHQTVRLEIDTKDAAPSIRISFTDQRLTAHGGLIVWSHFLRQKRFRQQLREVLPHDPTSPNAYDPTDVALGYVGGILAGADKLSRVAWLQSDAAVAEVLGVEAVASQSTLSRFFGVFTQRTCQTLGGLHARALYSLPSQREGYTLDLDSWALLHEDGHQEGVAVGYTRRGLKPCHRPLIAGLAEAKLIANYWLRSGNTACVNGAAEFLRQTVQSLPSHIRLGLVRGDSGFGDACVQDACEALRLKFIFAAKLTQKVQLLCRHDEAAWQTTEVPGLAVQEVDLERPGCRLIVLRQRVQERPQAGGKTLLELEGYRFQALVTNLPASVDALNVWRHYNGRADLENRIKELGEQFGIKRLCVQNFWGTEALHHLAIAAYNLCVLLQRRLGQLEKCELNTLRWRLFGRAAVWSRAGGKPTLKLAVRGEANQNWWREMLSKLTAPPNCHAVGSLQA